MGLGRADGLIKFRDETHGATVSVRRSVVSRFVLVRCGLNDVTQRKLK